jgi:ribosomal protein S18 acetylase RimI-like enzyme
MAVTIEKGREAAVDVQISLAQKEDYPEMIRMADVTLPDRMNLHELKKYLELFPELIFKATHEERMIGFGCAGVDMYQTTGWMLFSNVLPAFQGKGIGKRLIEARLKALLRIPQLQRVLVTVSGDNTASIRALESFGFRFKQRELDYYGPGRHRDILELPLLSAASVGSPIPAYCDLPYMD